MEASSYQKSKQVPRRPKRNRLSLACERCRLKKRKCTSETPCTHCIKDGMICSKQRRKRVAKFTIPSEESAEFYEFQIRRLSAAVAELYQRLDQTGALQNSSEGMRWPPAPQSVHAIVDMLNLPVDDDEPMMEDKPGHEIGSRNFTRRPHSNHAKARASWQIDRKLSNQSCSDKGQPSDNGHMHCTSSPSSSYLSEGPRSSDMSRSSSPSPWNDNELPDWWSPPEDNMNVERRVGTLPFGSSTQPRSQSPIMHDPILVPNEDWGYTGLPSGADLDPYTGAFDATLMRAPLMTGELMEPELSI